MYSCVCIRVRAMDEDVCTVLRGQRSMQSSDLVTHGSIRSEYHAKGAIALASVQACTCVCVGAS